MILAFSGTQRGMTPRQLRIAEELLAAFAPTKVRHGGCTGGDEEFHELCLKLAVPLVVVWPSNISSKWGHISSTPKTAVEMMLPKPPLLRNLDIVAGADHLIACPADAEEVLRSGTWATVRLSTRYNIPCTVIKPTDAPTQDQRRLG